jgi:hypothetical protein
MHQSRRWVRARTRCNWSSPPGHLDGFVIARSLEAVNLASGGRGGFTKVTSEGVFANAGKGA